MSETNGTKSEAVPCEPRYRKQIDDAFVGKLGSLPWNELRTHMLDCDGCRSYYDRLGAVDRALSGGASLSAAARDRIATRVLEGAAPPRPSFSSWALPVLGMVSAAGLAALIMFVPRPPADDGYGVRGRHDQKFVGRAPGVSAFCVRGPKEGAPDGAPRISDTARAQRIDLPTDTATLECRLDDELQLAYSSPRETNLFLVAWGETESGELLWYAPRQPDAETLPLKLDAVDEPLPWSTRLEVKHRPGKIRLRVRFLDRSMTADAARRASSPIEELAIALDVEPKE